MGPTSLLGPKDMWSVVGPPLICSLGVLLSRGPAGGGVSSMMARAPWETINSESMLTADGKESLTAERDNARVLAAELGSRFDHICMHL